MSYLQNQNLAGQGVSVGKQDAPVAGSVMTRSQAALGDPSLSLETNDPFELITFEHRLVEKEYAGFRNTQNLDQKLQHVKMIIKLLSVHAAKEEMYVYPLVQKYEGDEVFQRALSEHQGMKQVLYRLDGMSAYVPEMENELEILMADTLAHVAEEEKEVLPRLQKLCTPDEWKMCGDNFKKGGALAPTHPHPDAPSTGMAGKMANAAAAGVDKMRDAAGAGPAAPAQ